MVSITSIIQESCYFNQFIQNFLLKIRTFGYMSNSYLLPTCAPLKISWAYASMISPDNAYYYILLKPYRSKTERESRKGEKWVFRRHELNYSVHCFLPHLQKQSEVGNWSDYLNNAGCPSQALCLSKTRWEGVVLCLEWLEPLWFL